LLHTFIERVHVVVVLEWIFLDSTSVGLWLASVEEDCCCTSSQGTQCTQRASNDRGVTATSRSRPWLRSLGCCGCGSWLVEDNWCGRDCRCCGLGVWSSSGGRSFSRVCIRVSCCSVDWLGCSRGGACGSVNRLSRGSSRRRSCGSCR